MRRHRHPEFAQQPIVGFVEVGIHGGAAVPAPIAGHDATRQQHGVKKSPVAGQRPDSKCRRPDLASFPVFEFLPARECCPPLERRRYNLTPLIQILRGIREVLAGAQVSALVGDDFAFVKTGEQPVAEQFGLLGIASFAPARQGIQVAGRIVFRRELRKRLGDHRRSGFDQLLVVRTRQQILAILVGLPGCVQDAGDEARGMCREEGPELARFNQPVERCGPPDRHFVAVVARAPVGPGVRGQRVHTPETFP